MSALYPQHWPTYLSILFVVIRLLGFFILVPGFSHRTIPTNVRLLVGLAISLAIFPIVQNYLDPVPDTIGGLVGIALKESAVGLLMGFAAYTTFEGINLGAQFVGYQMGFGSASLIDPQNQSSVSVLVPFQGWIALMIFFFTDLHHEMLRVFVASFRITQVAHFDAIPTSEMIKVLIGLTGRLFILAIQIAAPFTLLILLCNAAIGVLARTMPQMNVMLLSFPVTILLGFCALYWLAPDLMDFMEGAIGEISTNIMGLLRTV